MKDLDGRDVPGAMIATTEFEDAANAQARAIGFAPGIVYIPHPIQNRTKEELAQIADNAIEPILKMITANGA